MTNLGHLLLNWCNTPCSFVLGIFCANMAPNKWNSSHINEIKIKSNKCHKYIFIWVRMLGNKRCHFYL